MSDQFDLYDVKYLGRPQHFIVKHFCEMIRQLVSSDEIKTALYLLDNLPGYFRDNPPEEVVRLKSALLSDLMSVYDYANDENDNDPNHDALQMDSGHCYPRGPLVRSMVKQLNYRGDVPFIYEVGAANFWINRGLRDANLKFVYNADGFKKFELLKENTTKSMFIAFEIIEHLFREEDLVQMYARFQKLHGDADYILISTPKYCLYHGLKWDEKENRRELGHLRTWTPKELTEFMSKHWPNRHLTMIDCHAMIMVSSKEPMDLNLSI